ncbi:hypothetical protein [Kineococcus auxinigenes]|uniref:hypothetical protein n=1 Tax=unclassified Kineococcus TaxID=2621656 RepID=UPI003D7D657D
MSPCPDAAPAAWLRNDPQPWNRLVSLGPVGLPAYARLRFLPDPTHPGQSENDAGDPLVQASETEQLRRVVDVLTAFTTTPQECFFLLWDGWGVHPAGSGHPPRDDRGTWPRLPGGPDTDSGRYRLDDGAPLLQEPPAGSAPGLHPRSARPGPLQPPADLHPAPVHLPNRDYHLFRGGTGDFGDWGPALPLRPSSHAPDPAFAWPADHAWCLVRDVDPHYAGIGAAAEAVEALVHRSGLDVVLADPAREQPHYW